MEFFRTLARKAPRIALIAAVASSIFLFGHVMTPRPPDAFAKVFLNMGEVMSSEGVPKFLKKEVQEGDVQEVYLNDNTLFYTLYSTDKSIDALLDYYEGLYGSENQKRVIAPPAAREAILDMVEDPKDRAEHARQIAETERLLNEQFIRFQGDAWGGFATIINGAEGEQNYSSVVMDNIRRFKQTGLVKDLGDPKIVVAFDGEEKTQYFNVWPGPDFDQRKIRPQAGEDAPGYDIPDIQRPRGTQRMVTFGQDNGGLSYNILIYRGAGTLSGTAEHFVAEMQQDGWAIATRFEEAKSQMEEPEHALLFAKDDREAYVSMKKLEGDDVITSTIVVSGPKS